MKTLKVKSIALGLVATFILVITIQSCTQQELPIPAEEPGIEAMASNLEPTTIELTQDNPIVIELKASEDIKHYNVETGELLWDMATMTTYNHEETLPLIMIPIHNEADSEVISLLIAAYNEADNSFLFIISSFEMDMEAEVTLGYTGKVVYSTLENEPAKSISYVNGEIVEQQQFDIADVEDRFNIYCYLNCTNWLGVPSSCHSAYRNCTSWVSIYNGWCHHFVGCILGHGGAIAACAYSCR